MEIHCGSSNQLLAEDTRDVHIWSYLEGDTGGCDVGRKESDRLEPGRACLMIWVSVYRAARNFAAELHVFLR